MKKKNKFGVYNNLSFDQYRQLPGINQTRLKQFVENGYNKRKKYTNFQALEFGNAGHCMLLEPEKFSNLYICAPKNLKQRKKNGKDRWKEFCNQHKDKIVLRYSDWSRLQNIKKSFQAHSKIKQFFSNGNSEVSLFWHDTEYGLNCKARLDWLDIDSKNIVDLKFTQNFSKLNKLKFFENNIAIQAYWYTRGLYQLTNIVSKFSYIFIEKFAPHFIQIVQISENDIKITKNRVDEIINNFNLLLN